MNTRPSIPFQICFFAFSILISASAGMRTSQAEVPPLRTVPYVDVQRYLGSWYEIAKFPNRFQKGCNCATANYSLRPDGDIKVVNSCIEESSERATRTSEGKAWDVDPETHSKLKVRFFWPFSGDYWIIDLGKDYEYSVVSEPGRDYLWILSRSPVMEGQVYEEILARLRAQGFDLSRLTLSRTDCAPVK